MGSIITCSWARALCPWLDYDAQERSLLPAVHMCTCTYDQARSIRARGHYRAHEPYNPVCFAHIRSCSTLARMETGQTWLPMTPAHGSVCVRTHCLFWTCTWKCTRAPVQCLRTAFSAVRGKYMPHIPPAHSTDCIEPVCARALLCAPTAPSMCTMHCCMRLKFTAATLGV